MSQPVLPAAAPVAAPPPAAAPAPADDDLAAVAAAAAAAAVAAQQASQRSGPLKRMVLAVGGVCAVLLGSVSLSLPAPHVPWDTTYSDPCLSYETDMATLLNDGLDQTALGLHAPAGCPSPQQIVRDYRDSHRASGGTAAP